MNPFPDELLIKDIGTVNGTQVFELLQDFRYNSKKFGMIVAHKGFQTTGISTPRILWPIIGPTSNAFKISIIHDVLFDNKSKYNLTNKQADEVMYEGMVELNVPWLERQAIFRALRLFSWMYWRKQ